MLFRSNEQKVQNQHVSQHNSNEMLPAVLRLTLKKKWFDMIDAGEDEKSALAKHPNDFILFELGDIDMMTGKVSLFWLRSVKFTRLSRLLLGNH